MDVWSPQVVGVIGQALFLLMFLFFWRIEWYLENQLLLSARMREQAAALENAGKLYHMFSKNLRISCFKRPSRGNITHSSFGFPLMYGAYSNKDYFPSHPSLPPPPTPRPLCWPWLLTLPIPLPSSVTEGRAALSVTKLGCRSAELARTDCRVAGGVLKWSSLKLFLLMSLQPGTKCWQKADTWLKKENAGLRTKRKGLMKWGHLNYLAITCKFVLLVWTLIVCC